MGSAAAAGQARRTSHYCAISGKICPVRERRSRYPLEAMEGGDNFAEK